jgi:hypothetical protein
MAAAYPYTDDDLAIATTWLQGATPERIAAWLALTRDFETGLSHLSLMVDRGLRAARELAQRTRDLIDVEQSAAKLLADVEDLTLALSELRAVCDDPAYIRVKVARLNKLQVLEGTVLERADELRKAGMDTLVELAEARSKIE